MYKNWFYRTLISYIPVFFILSAFLFFIFFQTLNEQNRKETIKINDFLASQSIQTIDASLRSVDHKISMEVMRNHDILQYFSDSPKEAPLYLQVKAMNFMRDQMIVNSFIDSMYIVNLKKEEVLGNSTVYPLREFPDYNFIVSKLDRPNTAWSPQREYREVASDPSRKVVTLTRSISIFSQDKGIMVVNVGTDSLYELVRNLYNPETSSIRLFDQSGKNMFQQSKEPLEPKSGPLVSSLTSDYSGWKIDAGIKQQEGIGFILNLYNVWFTVGIAVCLCAFIWVIYITRKNYKPLQTIVAQLQQHSIDNEAALPSAKHPNEFSFIHSIFENMIHKSNQFERQFAEDLKIKRNFFIYELLESTRQIGLKEWQHEAVPCHLPESFGRQNVFVMEVDRYADFSKRYPPQDQNLLKFAVENVIQELFKHESKQIWTLWVASNRLVGILYQGDPGQEYEIDDTIRIFEKFKAWMNLHLSFTVTIGIGSTVTLPMELRNSYAEAVESLQFKTVYGSDCVIGYSQDMQFKGNIYDHLKHIQAIVDAYRLSQPEWETHLTALFKEIQDLKMAKNDIVSLLGYLTFSLDKAIGAMSAEYQNIWKTTTYPNLQEQLSTIETLQELRHIYPQLLQEFARHMEELRESRNQRMMIKEVKTYIEEHFTNPELSLDYLGDKFGIASKYLSKLFKEEYGLKFVDFLIDVRMNHAQRLLTETTQSVQEIAEKLGYTSSTAFARTFKKVTGKPPGDYRRER